MVKLRPLRGTEAKILQYEENARSVCHKQIDLKDLIAKHLFKKQATGGCVVVNLEKDTQRYLATLDELKKVSMDKFIHLKGTYWKNKQSVERDLSFILDFLKPFNPDIRSSEIVIDGFSEVNDPNVEIQGGPLGCYCSHVRGMIYGYLNFQDYTIIVEDDISITDTDNIEKYLKCIPDDWDVVCLNSIGKNVIYNKPYYKFISDFHSTHFYIINNKLLPKLFANIYPITDQIDVLISDLIQEINVYNIPDTVYQKNIKTNTQNNLRVIFNSPHYEVVRVSLSKIEKLCRFFANKMLPDNEKRNNVIVSNIMYDVLYEYILSDNEDKPDQNKEDYLFNNSKCKAYREYKKMLNAIEFFLRCSKKGINTKLTAESLLNVMLYTIYNFKLHNKIDRQLKEVAKAYSFGSTAHVYVLEKSKVIIKKYNDKLRWTTAGYDNSTEIFTKELSILKKVRGRDITPQLIGYNAKYKIIKLAYGGESLYNNFNLPVDWKEQMCSLFARLDEVGINYPEFRLHNILILDGKMSFVDFGLANFDDVKRNAENCNRFISLIGILEKKFSTTSDADRKNELYSTFIKNLEQSQCNP